MKKIIFSTLSILPFLAFSAEPIEGVNYSGFKNSGNQSCRFHNAAIYSCEENGIGGNLLQTQVIIFNSKEELCTQLRDENLHSVSVYGISHSVGRLVRTKYINENCLFIPQLSKSELIKTMVCRITVEATDGSFGDSGVMQIPIAASGSTNRIFVNMTLKKEGSQFSTTLARSSRRYMDLYFMFQKGSQAQSDQLTLEAKQKNGKTLSNTAVSITGEARSGVALKIKNWGDVADADIQCAVADAQSIASLNTKSDYICHSTGTDAIAKLTTSSSIANLLGQALVFSDSTAKTTVSLNAEIPATAKFSAKFGPSSDSQVEAKANLDQPTEFKAINESRIIATRCK